MKIIDKNGRLFGKISVIDVLAILVVAVLAVALRFKSNQPLTGGSNVPMQPITFKVQLEAAPSYLEKNIHIGDEVYDQAYPSGGALGTIIDIQKEPGSTLATYSDATVAITPVDDTDNLVLTIQGEGLVTDRSWSINRVYDLGVHAARTYYTPYAQFGVTVMEIL